VGRRVDGRTDRHDEAHSSFPQFCERISQLHMDRPGIQGRSRKGGWGGGGDFAAFPKARVLGGVKKIF